MIWSIVLYATGRTYGLPQEEVPVIMIPIQKQWEIFTEKNAPMHEPWTYGVSAGDGKIFIAAWGGGVIEYTTKTKQFKDYTDPDGEMEIDLLPDDGVVHDITTATS